MLKMKWALVSAIAVTGLMGGVGLAQSGDAIGGVSSGVQSPELAKANKVDNKVDNKKASAELALPEARLDKARIMVLERKVALQEGQQLQQAVRDIQARAKELDVMLKDLGSKLQVEMISVLRGAGVDEKEFGKYEMNLETFKITKVEPVVEEKKK